MLTRSAGKLRVTLDGLRAVFVVILISSAVAAAGSFAEDAINPYQRTLLKESTVARWDFEDGAQGWRPAHATRLDARDGALVITCTGHDPYLYTPPMEAEGPLHLRFRMRSKATGGGQFFWITRESRNWGTDKRSPGFKMKHDGEWHTYEMKIDASGTVSRIRLDPGQGEGQVWVDDFQVTRCERHPLEITRIDASPEGITAFVKNHSEEAVKFRLGDNDYTVEAGETVAGFMPVNSTEPFHPVTVKITSDGLPALTRTISVHDPSEDAEWITLSNEELTLKVAQNGSGARLLRGDWLVAVLAPLAEAAPLDRHREIPELRIAKQTDDSVTLAADDFGSLTLTLDGNEIDYSLDAHAAAGGPVVRAVGKMEQGLLSGVEYLGEGEKSSSTRDFHTPEHVRFAPDLVYVTMPLMGFVTDRARVSLTWQDMDLQPVFATPNFFDGTVDHRMSLSGGSMEATIRVGPGRKDGGRMADVIREAVQDRGLPEPPDWPRELGDQWELCLKAYRGPINGDGGWGHCAGERWDRNYFADHVSYIWRISGDAPDVPRLVWGGAHISNPASYFVTGRANEWVQNLENRARGARRAQHADGSFRYSGKYTKGHWEDTASGFCANRTLSLLEHAWYTGDKKSLQAGLKTLEYMKRFRTPRGAQVWELSLHTPDILASAKLVKCYVRGYQLTGRAEYLKLARRWAMSGLPFVYQWSDRPMMLYGTIPVFGATNWQISWLGRPVQWCGQVYADALLMLARHDDTLNWRRIAKGIAVCGEQMQYPDGPSVGCLPDSVMLKTGNRLPADINPGAIISLRMQLNDKMTGIDMATGDGHRAVAPYPVTIRDGKVYVSGRTDTDYQVVIDSERVVDVPADEEDVIPLESRDN